LASNKAEDLVIIRGAGIPGSFFPAQAKLDGDKPYRSRSRKTGGIGLRNRLIHGDDSVDFDILWETVSDALPPFIASLEKILG
jgi:hypothetical protein